jgi:hypothetical protein
VGICRKKKVSTAKAISVLADLFISATVEFVRRQASLAVQGRRKAWSHPGSDQWYGDSGGRQTVISLRGRNVPGPELPPRVSLRGRSVSDNLEIAAPAVKHPYCQNVNPTAKCAFRCRPIARSLVLFMILLLPDASVAMGGYRMTCGMRRPGFAKENGR